MESSLNETRIPRSRKLLSILEECLGRESLNAERSLQLIEMSSRIAWNCHAGIFVLPHAERMIREHPGLSESPGSDAIDTRELEGRTLHVLTETYPVGGHTRLVKRWIELLDGEPHAVVLVRQQQQFNPDWVLPKGSNMPLINLEQLGMTRRRKVFWLMEMFRAARRVILHIHPDDACSVAAAYRCPEVDIHYLNHADHVSWLGAGLPAVFLNLRHRATRLAGSRRGIEASNCGMVPIPITQPAYSDRLQARRHFGIGENECLILTIASGYKYTPVGRRSLLEPLDRILARRKVKLMAVGIKPDHQLFARLEQRHPGQVLCLGDIPSPIMHRAAADIYLDSYPFGSITSMLESAAIGTPVVAYQPEAEELEILYSECPWLTRDQYAASNEDQLVDLLNALIDGSSLRHELSLRNLEGMIMHSPEAWKTSIREHQSRHFTKTPWRDQNIPPMEGEVDLVLSGLMQDVRFHVDQPQTLGLDQTGLSQIAECRRLGLL
jgi:hypothetical protein